MAVCMSACIPVHRVCAWCQGGQRWASDPLELEPQNPRPLEERPVLLTSEYQFSLGPPTWNLQLPKLTLSIPQYSSSSRRLVFSDLLQSIHWSFVLTDILKICMIKNQITWGLELGLNYSKDNDLLTCLQLLLSSFLQHSMLSLRLHTWNVSSPKLHLKHFVSKLLTEEAI